MPRQTRIQLVTGLAIFLLSLLVAFGGPVVLVLLVERALTADVNQVDAMGAQMQAMSRAAVMGQRIFLVGSGVAVVALSYTLFVLAVWFIGPPEEAAPNPVNRP